jgi:gamma-glutamylcyclotransferase (GGCT)/AIG2-like uncharacterized protein YtfP
MTSPSHSQPPLLFVYGTLKSGEHNHIGLAGAGLRRFVPGYVRGLRLYHLTPPNVRGSARSYPGLQPGLGLCLGECYKLGNDQLNTVHWQDQVLVLDHLEMEGYEYQRRLWWAWVGGQPRRVMVYVHCDMATAWRSRARLWPGCVWSGRRGQKTRAKTRATSRG